MKVLGKLKGALGAVGIVVVVGILVILLAPKFRILSRPWNLYVGLFIIVAGLVGYGIWWLIQRQRERRFESAILDQAQAETDRASVQKKADLQALTGRWKESLQSLKESAIGGRNVLTQLPWFVILGEPGCGKTTLIDNSGFDFPIGDAKIAGIGGTKNCDWWFANEAIILDTAGRYAFEVQSAPDRGEWDRFVSLLRKTRKKSAINGLMVAVPTDSLLTKDEDELRAYAQRLRGKINDMMTRLESVFPVYLIITKVDLVEGFVGFFSRYPAERIREAVGRTFSDLRPGASLEAADQTLSDGYDTLCSRSLALMAGADPGAAAEPYLMFPEEFRNLTEKLKVMLEALFKENIYMRNPVFRGVYMTSGTQEGRTIAAIISDTMHKLGIDADMGSSHDDTTKKPYFVRDLFGKILLEDVGRKLVRPLSLGGKQQFMRAFKSRLLPGTLVAVLLLAWIVAAYRSNAEAWSDLNGFMQQNRDRFSGEYGRMTDGSDLRERIDLFDSLSTLHANATDRSYLGNLFLNRGDPADFLYEAEYQERFNEAITRPVIDRRALRILEGRGDRVSKTEYLEILDGYTGYLTAARFGGEPMGGWQRTESLLVPWLGVRDQYMLEERKPAFARLLAYSASIGPPEVEEPDWTQVNDTLTSYEGGGGTPGDLLAALAAIDVENDPDGLNRVQSIVDDALGGPAGPEGVREERLTRITQDLARLDAPGALVDRTTREKAVGAAGAEGASTPMVEVAVAIQEIVAYPVPTDCPPLECADPEGVEEVVTTIEAFDGELEESIAAVRTQVSESSPESLSQVRKVLDDVRRRKVTELYETCAGDFQHEFGLSQVSRCIGADGEVSASEQVLPVGAGVFSCPHVIQAGGISEGARSQLEALNDGVDRLWDLSGNVQADLITRHRTVWRNTHRNLGRTGGGGYGGALDSVQFESQPPDSWQALPDAVAIVREIASDGTLAEILDKIGANAGSGDRTKVRRFRHQGYLDGLSEIADGLDAAQSGKTGVLDWVVEVAGTGGSSNPILATRRYAGQAPTSELQRLLVQVPERTWTLALSEAARQLDALYQDDVYPALREFPTCFPFSSTGPDCSADSFNGVFGPGGSLARLGDYVARLQKPKAAGIPNLEVRSDFQGMLRTANRIRDAYETGAFEVAFSPDAPSVEPAEGVKENKIGFGVAKSTLTLNGTGYPPLEEGVLGRLSAQIPVKEDISALTVELTSEKGGFIGKMLPGGAWKDKDMDWKPLQMQPGAWSFLKMLRAGRPASGGTCCTWTIPANVKKSGKHGADLLVRYRLDSNSAKLLDESFWNLGEIPDRVTGQ
jgi:hypothetical protein